MAMSSNHSIITISYTELHQSSPSPSTLFAKIAQGFGNQDDCKGIIAITDIPNYPALRSKALTLIHRLATQTSQEVLEELEDPKSYYAVGWSHGKEKVEADKFDLGKGSFYFNPITDDPLDAILERDFGNGKVDEEDLEEEQTTLEIPTETMARRERERTEFLSHAEGNGAFYAPNIWPDKALPELRETAMEMGGLIRDIGKLVARQCDEYVLSQCDTDTYSSGKIQNVIDNSLCCKGRLLHYFPVFVAPVEDKNDANANANANANSNGVCENDNQDQTVAKDVDFSDWCGWHNDHCSLTGLVPAMYFNSDGEEVSCPDPAAGLYIKSRNGALVHVQVPSDALAFQIGETSQIHTGGILQATPHAVRGCDPALEGCKGVSREAFAVFMEPEYFGDMDIPVGKTIEDAQKKDTEKYFPKNVATLRSRWSAGMNFGQFSEATFSAFY